MTADRGQRLSRPVDATNHRRTKEHHLGFGLREDLLPLQELEQGDVVHVLLDNELTPRVLQAPIERANQPQVALVPDEDQPLIVGHQQCTENVPGGVGGAVVLRRAPISAKISTLPLDAWFPLGHDLTHYQAAAASPARNPFSHRTQEH